MLEDLFDHRRIFDARNHLDRATTVGAGLDSVLRLIRLPWGDKLAA